jgi:PrsW family intramembrane metalloprotease
MDMIPEPAQTSQTQASAKAGLHIPSIWQLGLSLIAILALWSMAVSMAALGLVQRFSPASAAVDPLPFFLMSAGLFLVGALLLPSAGYALRRLMGRSSAPSVSVGGFLIPLIVIALVPLALLAGSWVASQQELAWLLLPPFHILAISLPILFITYLAIHGLSLGSPQRFWGIFAAGSFLGPVLIFTAEIMVLLAVLAIGVLWLSSQPGLISSLTAQMEKLQNGSISPEQVQQLLLPYLTKPAVIISIGIFAAVIVPLIEELLKPIGVWFLVGTSLTPAGGFVAGILCGAGYALIESLGLASSGEEWASLAVARMGTAGIHIITTGLSVWALALAWRQNRYLRLGGVYLFNVLYHGLWNALTLAIVVTSLPRLGNMSMYSGLEQVAKVAPAVLVGMAILSITGLLAANWYLSKNQAPETPTG